MINYVISFIFSTLLIFLLPHANAEITGIASVIDGDTLEIHGQRIRLFGIDAPESDQQCSLSTGKAYRCGQRAAFILADKIQSKTLHCHQKSRDRYERVVAECFTKDINLNAWMVRNGWALAYRQYSTDYIAQENAAKSAKAGIWAGAFKNPADYRHGPSDAEKLEHGKCLIKGNINGRGKKIYHVPGTTWYGKTKIDIRNNERWFCTENEALSAGWQKAGS